MREEGEASARLARGGSPRRPVSNPELKAVES